MRPAGSESGGGGRRASGRRRSVVGRRAGSREAPGARSCIVLQRLCYQSDGADSGAGVFPPRSPGEILPS